METFANILNAYGDDRAICDAAIAYARVEYHPPSPDSIEAAAEVLSAPIVETLRAYVTRLPDEAVTTGRGLYLVSADAHALSLAVQFLQRALEQGRVRVCHLRADRPVSAANRRFALAAPVLLVERIDFMRDPIPNLLSERANLVRPMIVTSMQAPDTAPDPYLRRVFASMTRIVEISPALPLPTNGPVSAKSER